MIDDHDDAERDFEDVPFDFSSGCHWSNPPLAEAFRAFDDANPNVYTELVRLVKLWHDRRGREHLGIGMLWETMRWNLAIVTTTDEPFKLNNNHRSYYARKLMKHEDGADSLFQTRKRDVTCECSTCVAAA